MSKIVLENVRCSYVFIQDRRQNDDGTPGKYGLQILLPKDSPQYKPLMRLIKQTLMDRFGDTAWDKKGGFKLPVRDGDDERDGEEYENVYFMNANSDRKPGIGIARNGRIETADEDDLNELCYSGAYFHVSINVYAFPKAGASAAQKGVALGLNNVLLVKKGDRLDGSTSANEDFKQYASVNEGYGDFEEDDDF